MTMGIFQKIQGEFGTKLTSITMKVVEINIVFCSQMMG